MLCTNLKVNKEQVMQSLRFISKRQFLASMLFLLTVSFILKSASTHAQTTIAEQITTEKINIPVIAGARIFARFDDNIPAVINYFTPLTEDAVVTFYNENYGKPVQSERRRGRLTLHYQQELQNIRVVISLQNNLRQVDVLVENTLPSQ